MIHVDRKYNATLHGHAISSAAMAKHAGIPCSMKETLFSTYDDLEALMNLVFYIRYIYLYKLFTIIYSILIVLV